MSGQPGGGWNYNFDPKEPIHRVYDMSYYGYDYTFSPLDPNPKTVTSITNSTATRAAAADSTATPAGKPITAMWDTIISNTDTLPLLGAAANTDLDVTFQLTPDMTALIHEVNFNVWFGLACTAYTSGSPNLNNVRCTVTYDDTGEIVANGLGDVNVNTGFSALSGTGAQLFNFNVTLPKQFLVLQERTLNFRFRTTSVTTGTNTTFLGIVSFCSFGKQLSPAIPLVHTNSLVRLHIHPTVTHVNPNFISGQDMYP